MTRHPIILLSLAAALVSGCGGMDEIDLSCDKPQAYQSARETERVVAPEDLDQLDLSREMPVPSASARPDREPGSPCLDLPPRYVQGLKLTGGEKDEDTDNEDDGS